MHIRRGIAAMASTETNDDEDKMLLIEISKWRFIPKLLRMDARCTQADSNLAKSLSTISKIHEVVGVCVRVCLCENTHLNYARIIGHAFQVIRMINILNR